MRAFMPHADWFPWDSTSAAEDVARIAFGGWVRAARRRLVCSQAAFGVRVGLHQSTISRIERGQLRHLVFATAIRLFVVILEALAIPRPADIPVFRAAPRW